MKNLSNNIHITEEEMEQIDHYLNGELSGPELESFEKRLTAETGCLEKVEEIKLLSLGIQQAGVEQMLDKFHRERQTAQIVPINNYVWKKWLVAASVIAAVLVTAFLVFSKPKNERLFSAYYKPDAGLPVVMGEGNTSDYDFYDAMIDYKEGSYAKAIQKWKSIGDSRGYSDTLNYYIGMANMRAGDMDMAVNYLDGISKKTLSVYSQKATWYLALIYIKKSDNNTARKLLSTVKEIPEASELLSAIEQ